MKRLVYLSGLAGLLGLTALVAQQGWQEVARTLAQGGWLLLLLLPLHGLPLLLDAQGWRTLLRSGVTGRQASLLFLWWVAGVREAVNRLLPTASVGGELVGIRLARLRLNDATTIAASIVVEVALTLFAQYVYTALGVLILLAAMPAGASAWVILAGLLLSLPVPLLFFLALRHGALFARLEGVARHVLGAGHRLAGMIAGVQLDGAIRALLRRRGALLQTLGWQLAGMLLGSAEVWCALRWLGQPVSLWQALAIEALTQATRQMAFFVPAGLGVQEAAVLLLGELLGISAPVALSMALVKRARELLFGLPMLLSWQWLEWRRWRHAGHLRPQTRHPDRGQP